MSFGLEDYRAVLEEFRELADEKYKKFNESLIPGTETAYGVSLPALRAISKRIVKDDPRGFLAVSRTDSYEEVLLRGVVIASMKAEI